MGVRFGAAALLLVLAIESRQIEIGTRFQDFSEGNESRSQKTTRDKLFSKEQAARGTEVYVKYCQNCHTPEKVPPDKKPGPPVVGDKFLEAWIDRPLGELFSTIFTTMPSDGSAVLTTDQALDVTAHILMANGFPEGTAPLKNDDTMKSAIIVK